MLEQMIDPHSPSPSFHLLLFDSLIHFCLVFRTASISIIGFFFFPIFRTMTFCLLRHPKIPLLVCYCLPIVTSLGLRDISPNNDHRFKSFTESFSLLIWFPRNSSWKLNYTYQFCDRWPCSTTLEIINTHKKTFIFHLYH